MRSLGFAMHDEIGDTLNRGHAAETLLQNETFNAVCEDILKIAAVRWLATDETETVKREQLHNGVRAIQALRAELQERADAATKVQADLDKQERRRKEI